MLYREIIAVCSQIHTKHINTLCGQNVELLNVKPDDSYSNYWGLKGQWFYYVKINISEFIRLFIILKFQRVL
jgi:hypothetical protein